MRHFKLMPVCQMNEPLMIAIDGSNWVPKIHKSTCARTSFTINVYGESQLMNSFLTTAERKYVTEGPC